ncbi:MULTISPECIES: methionine/alanine import family NSS transporter small subunit [unclassified Actinobaculum]|uniref:methionine/alanine import family NSS transporter small subunit n=1 Tax=unclassified Actinobaculum TaxID=2609299 RepID=UPI000D52976A|nr:MULTISPECIES: methionine/alanine import family NSS transporter small subunit [unclassified Actinobaculum]AWE41899.1 putative methionine/alanine importer small subunit [Actinobaculum sp. 313]RTE50185.1 methionine/alanine import family NSS transporter small subunit [Actinobaculum sp. 352]
MAPEAIVCMLVSILIIWGGLIGSVTALVQRGHREAREAQTAATEEVLRELLDD